MKRYKRSQGIFYACDFIQLKYAKISSPQNGGIKRGVIFATYSSLISESQNASTKVKYNSRLKQLIQWLGGDEFDGVVSINSILVASNHQLINQSLVVDRL